jgi:hypothetical protein
LKNRFEEHNEKVAKEVNYIMKSSEKIYNGIIDFTKEIVELVKRFDVYDENEKEVIEGVRYLYLQIQEVNAKIDEGKGEMEKAKFENCAFQERVETNLERMAVNEKNLMKSLDRVIDTLDGVKTDHMKYALRENLQLGTA